MDAGALEYLFVSVLYTCALLGSKTVAEMSTQKSVVQNPSYFDQHQETVPTYRFSTYFL